jgi:hypothetical protein
LHVDELSHDLLLSLKSQDLSLVRVFEGIGSKVNSRSFSHQINHDLDESLLI